MTRKISCKNWSPSIETYPGGVMIFGKRGHGRGNDKPPKRGEIKGWSSSSRKRMREWMLTHQGAEGFRTFGLTLTVPGPPLEPDRARWLWNHFAKHCIVRGGMGAVWRIEVQKRGAVHWHCLLVAPKWWSLRNLKRRMTEEWLNALDLLPPWWVWRRCEESDPVTPGTVRHIILPGTPCSVSFDVARERPPASMLPQVPARLKEAADHVNGRRVLVGQHAVFCERVEEAHRMARLSEWPGVREHAVDVQIDGGRGAWLRYLQDHATKAKQEQIAQGFGRHWGVVGRGCFVETKPEGEMVFTSEHSYSRFWRAYHRLTRPVSSWRVRREQTGEKYAGRIFGGRSLGWSSSRGVYGVSVWFSRPETVQRLWEWAESVKARNEVETLPLP